MMIHRITLLILLTLFTCISHAQTTIGTNSKAMDGALLQLKENEELGANSSKGLGMPRVKLTDYTSLIDLGANLDAMEHIGLMVYNLNECLFGKGDDQGLYIWDGIYWQPLTARASQTDDVRSVIDDGVNKITTHYKDETVEYYYASFGDAGVWLTSHLRTKYAKDGSELIAVTAYQEGVLKQKTYFATPQNHYLYSNRSVMDLDDKDFLCNFDQVVVAGNKPGPKEVESIEMYLHGKPYVQGICPKGWHVPSDREWNLLEKELTENWQKYTQNYTASPVVQVWNDAWNTIQEFRGNIQALVAVTSERNSEGSPSNGRSKKGKDGGLDIIYPGVFSKYGHIYPGDIIIYTSSRFSSTSNHDRWMRLRNNNVLKATSSSMGSLRCKKN